MVNESAIKLADPTLTTLFIKIVQINHKKI
jgi:hypothetical protein